MLNESNNTNMESNIYPMFRDGQVLSSSDLNLLFSYLNEQDKKTRSMLYGYGVISGLQVSVDKEKGIITISKGQAVTKSGNIIDVQEKKEYIYVDVNNNCLMTEAKSENTKTISEFVGSNDLSNYFVKIDYEVETNAIEYCNESSCSIRSSVNKVAYIPKLLEKQASDNTETTDDIKELVLDRVVNVLNFKELSVFLRTITNRYYSNLAKIKEKIKNLPSLDDATHFTNIIDTLDGQKFRFDTSNAEAYLSFILDMQKAINEYIGVYNTSKTKYSHYVVTEQDINSVILGSLDDTLHISRDSFEEAYQDYGQARNLKVVNRHAMRIIRMIKAFNPSRGERLILPTSSKGLLGEQIVPAYYNLSDIALKEVWDAHNFQHIGNRVLSQNENDNVLFDNLYHKADAFVLSGYADMHISDVSKYINEQIDKHNIPIDFVCFDLEGKRESLELEEYDITNVNNDSVEIDRLIELFKNNLDDLDSNTQNGFPAAIKEEIFEEYLALNVKQAANKLQSLDNTSIELEKHRQAIFLMLKKYKDELSSKQKHYLGFVIRSIVYATTDSKQLAPQAKSSAEYIGKVLADNVLVAVCHFNRVMLCVNLKIADFIAYRTSFRLLKGDADLADIDGFKHEFQII